MLIEKRSTYSGRINVMDLPVTKQQIEDWLNGEMIQVAMPNLHEAQREFLITGMTFDEQQEFYNNLMEY